MIISVEKAKTLIDFNGWTDEKIEMKLKAVEQTIRAYTNNNFQARGYRVRANITGGVFSSDSAVPFAVGDTVEVSESRYNNGLYVVSSVDEPSAFEVKEKTQNDDDVLVTKIVYPADVVGCCVNLMEWELTNRAKVGIQSETLSRHSVTYFNQDTANQIMGYPVSLLGCIKAYRKVRC